MSKRLKLGQMLVDAGVLTPGRLEEALNAQLIYGGKLGTNLVELGFVTEEFLTGFLSQQCNVPAVSGQELDDIPLSVIQTFSSELADKHRAVPFRKEKRRVDVAILDPTNLESVDELAFLTNCSIRPHVAPEVSVVRALERYYGIPLAQRYIRIVDETSSPASAAPRAPQPLAAPARGYSAGGQFSSGPAPAYPAMGYPPAAYPSAYPTGGGTPSGSQPAVHLALGAQPSGPQPAVHPALGAQPSGPHPVVRPAGGAHPSGSQPVVHVGGGAHPSGSQPVVHVGGGAHPSGSQPAVHPAVGAHSSGSHAAVRPAGGAHPSGSQPVVHQAGNSLAGAFTSPAAGQPAAAPPAAARQTAAASPLEAPPPALPIRSALAEAIPLLLHAESNQKVIEAVLQFSRSFFAMRLVFAIRAEAFELIVQEAEHRLPPRALSVPIRAPNIFFNVAKTKGYHVGPMPPHADNITLLEQLGQDSLSTTFVAPLVYQGRAEIIFLGVGLHSSFSLEHIRCFQLVLEKAAVALQILSLRKRLVALPEDLR